MQAMVWFLKPYGFLVVNDSFNRWDGVRNSEMEVNAPVIYANDLAHPGCKGRLCIASSQPRLTMPFLTLP